MKNILYTLLIVIMIFTNCNKEEIPSANFSSFEIDTITATPGDMQVTLNWTKMKSSSPEGYYITCTTTEESDLIDSDILTYTIDSLENDKEYTFTVQADYGKKGRSGVKTIKCTPVSSRMPISDLITSAGFEAMKAIWEKPNVDNVTGYLVTLSPGDISVDISDTSKTSTVITGLTNNVEYTVSVYAKYAIGNSEAVTSIVTPGVVEPISQIKTHILEDETNTYVYNELYFMKEISSVSWNFGDGATSDEVSPTHSFTTPGKFEVSMTANYTDGTNSTGSIYTIVIGYKWEFLFDEHVTTTDAGGAIKSNNPVFGQDGTVYINMTGNGNYGHLIAINPDGTLKWSFENPTGYVYGGGPVVGDDGTIYFGSYDDKLYAVNTDGTLKWDYTTNGDIYNFPAIASNGNVYLSSGDKILHALSSDGTVLWTDTLDNTPGSIAIGNDGKIYVGTRSNVFCYNDAGDSLWAIPALCTERSSFAINGNTLYVPQRDEYGLLAISMSTGSILWTYTATDIDDIYSPIVGKDGSIYFGCKGKQGVYAVNSDGTLKWNLPTECTHNYSHPVIDENNIVYITSQADSENNSHIFAINGDDGSILWQLNRSNITLMQTGSSISPNGVLYVGTQGNAAEKGRLLAIDIFAGLETSSWSIRGGNSKGNSRQE